MVRLGIPVLSILYKYWYPRMNQQRGTVVFPQTLQIQSDHLNGHDLVSIKLPVNCFFGVVIYYIWSGAIIPIRHQTQLLDTM